MALLLPLSTSFLQELTYDIEVFPLEYAQELGLTDSGFYDLDLTKLKKETKYKNLKQIVSKANIDQCYQINFQDISDCW